MEYILGWERTKTACFTGHRQIKEPAVDIEAQLEAIIERLLQKGIITFCAGGARGFDTLAAKTVVRLQVNHPEMGLVLILPFKNQYQHETGWTSEEIAEYSQLKGMAAQVIHLQENYSSGCYYRRNRCLVDSAAVCVAYQYRKSGGTAYTTRYAKARGIPVINCI